MSVLCGIIAEYNPFHLGHAHQLAETRRRLGANTLLVCAMSGNYVQRGDFALLDKYERAAMAIEGGADLVVELPLPAALSSAEGFARGGVAILDALGCTHLSFGAECSAPTLFQQAAAIQKEDAFKELLTEYLRKGQSYPAAVQAAMKRLDPKAAALLSHPNNTLGVAYCAALAETGMQPLLIPRAGAAHDSNVPEGGFASASHLRGLIHVQPEIDPAELSQTGWARWMLPSAADRLAAALCDGRAPMRIANCDTALLAHLRRMDADDLRRYASSADGFAERLAGAIQAGCTYEEVCRAAQTKRFPLARVRRTLLRAYLDIPEDASPEPKYIRVLALGTLGAQALNNAKDRLPLINKPTVERELDAGLQPSLRRDACADALYALAAPNPKRRSAQARWRKTPLVLR